MKYLKWWGVLFVTMLLQACVTNPLNVDVSKIDANISYKHFDFDLMNGPNVDSLQLHKLRQQYGSFFDVFCHRILRLPIGNDSIIEEQLNRFKNDADIKDIYAQITKTYATHTDVQQSLTDFARHLHYYFPQKPLPQFVSYLSAFNYGIITTDSIIGIGLDFYLGSDCKFYPSLQFPQYVIRKLNKENIGVSVIQAYYQKEWEQDVAKNTALDYMIYEGKKMYFTDAMSPNLSPALKIGYTQAQWEWAEKYEQKTWAAFLESKLLFEKDYKKFIKLVSDGPNTPGFDAESPPKLGTYLGWKIVMAYMERNKHITLQQLCAEMDAQKILQDSKYKP